MTSWHKFHLSIYLTSYNILKLKKSIVVKKTFRRFSINNIDLLMLLGYRIIADRKSLKTFGYGAHTRAFIFLFINLHRRPINIRWTNRRSDHQSGWSVPTHKSTKTFWSTLIEDHLETLWRDWFKVEKISKNCFHYQQLVRITAAFLFFTVLSSMLELALTSPNPRVDSYNTSFTSW